MFSENAEYNDIGLQNIWGNMWTKITVHDINMMTGGEKDNNLRVPGELCRKDF